jgi:hypothetical protein
MNPVIDRLLKSDEPCIRYRIRAAVLSEDPETKAMRSLRRDIASSPRALSLLSETSRDGTIPRRPYQKWTGAHWVATLLSEMDYPPGDLSIRPLVDQGVSFAVARQPRPSGPVEGRWRRCASQQGNAIRYAIRLGFADHRVEAMVKDLLVWQWPDGGWNCDQKPAACHASFHESLIPLRGLNAYAQASGDADVRHAVQRAADMFLERQLHRRKTTGEVIRPRFAATHYPYFWQYTFLHGLKAMVECGMIHDPRCAPALGLLESKRTPDGGFPAERKYYSVISAREERSRSGQTPVGWGPVSPKGKTENAFVTSEAVCILAAAGRL